MDSLPGKELVGMSYLTKTIKEQRQIVVKVKVFNLNLQMLNSTHLK